MKKYLLTAAIMLSFIMCGLVIYFEATDQDGLAIASYALMILDIVFTIIFIRKNYL